MAAGPLALRRPRRLSAGKTALSWSSEGCLSGRLCRHPRLRAEACQGASRVPYPLPQRASLGRAWKQRRAVFRVVVGRLPQGGGQRPRPLGRRLLSQGRGDGFPGWKTSHSPSWLPPSQPAPGDHGLSAPLRDSKAAWQAAHADVRFLPSRLHARHQQSPWGPAFWARSILSDPRVGGSRPPSRSASASRAPAASG